ncbi:MAG: TonB-dependent receptor plug domain-containing protein, partial [Hoylesella buccalis]
MNKKEKLWLVILLSCMLMSSNTLVSAQDIEHIPRQHLKDTITLGEVVVKSKRQLVTPNSVSATLTHDDIARAAGKSLASMLENVSGVSMLQTGSNVAKPVIHGMYGNRILVVSRGARLTGQQWGIDHAPEIDKNAFNDVVVVKGSESVRYGAEALGGIILM